MEINKNNIFSACGWVQIYGAQLSSSGDHVLPLLDVASPSAGISLISGLQHQAWCCKVLTWGSNGSGWDKYTGCEMKSILMSLSVQTVFKLFLQNTRHGSSVSPEMRSLLLIFLFSVDMVPSVPCPELFILSLPLGFAAAVTKHCLSADLHRNKVSRMTYSSCTCLLEIWNMKIVIKWILSYTGMSVWSYANKSVKHFCILMVPHKGAEANYKSQSVLLQYTFF